MLFKTTTHPTREVKILPVIVTETTTTKTTYSDEDVSKAELRRQMYERIAQGNGLAEAEEHAHQAWKGR